MDYIKWRITTLGFLIKVFHIMNEEERKRLWNTLNEINTNIQNINNSLIIHIAESKSTNEKIEDHNKKLYGNGKDGLIIVVDRLEKSKERSNKLNWLIVAALVPLVVTALWGLFSKAATHQDTNTPTHITKTP